MTSRRSFLRGVFSAGVAAAGAVAVAGKGGDAEACALPVSEDDQFVDVYIAPFMANMATTERWRCTVSDLSRFRRECRCETYTSCKYGSTHMEVCIAWAHGGQSYAVSALASRAGGEKEHAYAKETLEDQWRKFAVKHIGWRVE